MKALLDAVDELLAQVAADDWAAVWDAVLDGGWPLAGIPEEHGGAGGTTADLVAIVTRAARHRVRIPLAETALAAWVLARAGRSDLLADLRVGTVAVPEAPVPWARAADLIVRYGPGGAALLRPGEDEVTVEEGANIADEPRDRLRAAAGTPLPGAPALAEVRVRAGLLRAAACVGAAEAALDLTRRHVTTREQFGRPLARIPAVAGGVAIMAGELDQARAALDRAARAPGSPAAVAAARLCAGRAASTIARLAHQLHGAIGITREYDLHVHTRRLWAWRDEDGGEHSWAVELGTAAAEGTEQRLWDVLTGVPAE